MVSRHHEPGTLGNLRQPQPSRCPALHKEPWPFTGKAFSDDLHDLGPSQISQIHQTKQAPYTRTLGSTLNSALENISGSAGCGRHSPGEKGGKPMCANIVLKLGTRENNSLRRGVSGGALC